LFLFVDRQSLYMMCGITHQRRVPQLLT